MLGNEPFFLHGLWPLTAQRAWPPSTGGPPASRGDSGHSRLRDSDAPLMLRDAPLMLRECTNDAQGCTLGTTLMLRDAPQSEVIRADGWRTVHAHTCIASTAASFAAAFSISIVARLSSFSLASSFCCSIRASLHGQPTCLCMVLWQINSARVAGVRTPTKPVCGKHVAGTVML